LNKLSKENSPYLLQHQNNPVDWFPWGEEALTKAKHENKPIFLSIGYAACHWCHVMAHESFEDPKIAAIMNDYFINIKVDREERPELDDIYMAAVTAMTGQGGWPMSVFLTPDGEPFYGGTYFPPVQRYNMPSFPEILQSVHKAWEEDHEKIIASGKSLTAQINKKYENTKLVQNTFGKGDLSASITKIENYYDWQNGGWGKAPKFPQPMTLRFLLQIASQGNEKALLMATDALDKMAPGGMYDVLGGGFARYSVDDIWLVPHFEKMLYDNAQLARVYLHAYLITKNEHYKQICTETLDFILEEMTHPEGGFFSSLDADSEGVEGKYYVWGFEELKNIIKNEDDRRILLERFDISSEGNFEGHIILRIKKQISDIATTLNVSEKEVQDAINNSKKLLFDHRATRVRPATDDKVLTGWNAWAAIAFAEAGRYLHRDDYTNAAINNAQFLENNLTTETDILRSWRNGQAKNLGYLEDYASLILASLAIYQTTQEVKWFSFASKWLTVSLDKFSDELGNFYDTANNAEKLITRPSNKQDNATPSGSSLLTEALLLMNAYTGNSHYYDLANKLFSDQYESIQEYPLGYGNWLSAAFLLANPIKEIAIVSQTSKTSLQENLKQIWDTYRPNLVVASKIESEINDFPPLLDERITINGKTSYYICEKFVCSLPITNAKDFKNELKNIQLN
jgi:uncharacterized protein